MRKKSSSYNRKSNRGVIHDHRVLCLCLSFYEENRSASRGMKCTYMRVVFARNALLTDNRYRNDHESISKLKTEREKTDFTATFNISQLGCIKFVLSVSVSWDLETVHEIQVSSDINFLCTLLSSYKEQQTK